MHHKSCLGVATASLSKSAALAIPGQNVILMVVLTVLVLSYHTFPSSSHSLASVFLTIDSLRVTSPGGYSSTRIREAGQVGQARTMMEDWGQISEFLYPTLSHYIILCLHINCHYCKYVERERHTHIFIGVSVFELTSLRSLFRYNVCIYIYTYVYELL